MLLSLSCLALIGCSAYGAVEWWDWEHAGGNIHLARSMINDSDPALAKQGYFRAHSDASKTIEVLIEHSAKEGWRGDYARIYLAHLRDQLKD